MKRAAFQQRLFRMLPIGSPANDWGIDKDTFVKLMLDAEVPQYTVEEYLENLRFTDDTYAVDPSTF